MHQYVANRNVFNDCLKLFPLIIGFRKLSGREFQTDGAELVTRYNQELLGGGSKMFRDATQTTGWHNSTRY